MKWIGFIEYQMAGEVSIFFAKNKIYARIIILHCHCERSEVIPYYPVLRGIAAVALLPCNDKEYFHYK